MRALTLTQPWAQLVADGRKRFETRSWPARILKAGDLLAIHAAKGWQALDRFDALNWGYEPNHLPRGAIVALVRYHGCMRTEYAHEAADEAEYGDYTPGRWAWKLELVGKLAEPVPCRGALGLWELSDEVLMAVLKAEEATHDQ